jgi:hypothetical protein
MSTAVLPMEKLAPGDLHESVEVPATASKLAGRDRATSVQPGATESEPHPGDWIAAKLLFVSMPLMIAVNAYDFIRGLLGF